MLANTLSHYIGIPASEVNRLLGLSAQVMCDDPTFKQLVGSLDRQLLEETVVLTREAYRANLEHLASRIEEKYHLPNPVMSPFTLGNWLVGFLYAPERLPDLLERHTRVPTEALREGLPEILEMLETLPQAKAEWQRAMSLLSLPLLVK